MTAPISFERGALLALVAERVRLRFALDAASFAARLVELAGEASPGSEQPSARSCCCASTTSRG